MSGPRSRADTAFRVAERLKRVPGPWDVYAERTRSYEVHLGGAVVELTRGPIILEGYGLRLLRDRQGKTAVGFQASTDASEEGVRAVVEDAEAVSRFSEFPAKNVTLPSTARGGAPGPEVADPALWDDAPGVINAYTASLIAALTRSMFLMTTGTFGAARGFFAMSNRNRLRRYPSIARRTGISLRPAFSSYSHATTRLWFLVRCGFGIKTTVK